MKFTLSWLKDHLDTTATLTEITNTLTRIGLEVEEVVDHSAAIKDFTVAEILAAEQHPNADKLRICTVNDGAGLRQVVCGAPNARAGIKVVLAKEGVKIPANGLVIKKSSIRGVESNGMLCSSAELGISGDSEGILELPASVNAGEQAAEALGLNDPVIEIAITPNRADCLGVRGIARDLAAAGIGTFINRVPDTKCKAQFASTINVHLQTHACPLFIGCTIQNITNIPSPDWLQNRLRAIGLRPISALVDITNYITFTYGRPLHVFDADKIRGNIVVRPAKAGEILVALNDRKYSLDDSMVAVCDDSGVLGLGGIIGGSSTGCSADTKNVFLEAALFNAVSIASTGRKLMIDSDARYRFERGVDPAFVRTGAEIAIAMIQEYCGGEASELVVAGAEPEWKKNIHFDYAKIEKLGGVHLPQEKAAKMLASLGCEVNGNAVTPPSWRGDITQDADLVEEVLRINFYDNIPSLPLPAAKETKISADRTALIRQALALQGMTEICSWAFMGEEKAERFRGGYTLLKLLNPISMDMNTMRPSLLPNLFSALARNSARGFSSLSLFEIGNIFKDSTPQGQMTMAAGMRSGEYTGRNPLNEARQVDLFDAKQDLFLTLEAAGLTPAKLQCDRNVPDYYHPARSGRISLGGKVTLGFFGEIHPAVLDMFDIRTRVVTFEIHINAIPLPKGSTSKTRPALIFSNFQRVERDFAFIADEKTAASDIIKAIEGVDKNLIQSASIFDIYSGKGVEAGKKSIAVSIALQATDRTLSEQEINTLSQTILQTVARLGVMLRT